MPFSFYHWLNPFAYRETPKENHMYIPKARRAINLIVIHCTANAPYVDVGVEEIDRWHKKRGWSGIGYHAIIRKNGKVELGRDINKSGAHAYGHNKGSIGVALVGGLGDDGRPAPKFKHSQWHTLRKVVEELQEQYPGVRIAGHNELGPKACPSFKVGPWLERNEIVPVR